MGSGDSLGLVGQEIHECRVVRVVGEGGFAVVYEGVHVRHGTRVALKCLKRPEAFTPEQWVRLVEKFEDECRLLRHLGKIQPAIVKVLAAGKYSVGGGRYPYMIMEWLDGVPLDSALRRRVYDGLGPFPEETALALGEQLLVALATAHGGITDEEGRTHIVTHRDIKPENLFYMEGPDGTTLKLIDFGIAKLRRDSPDREEDPQGVVTIFQAFSPAYAAPEQFSKNYGDTGTWTDVYAVGLLLTELVTGRRTLDGDDIGALFVSTMNPARPTPRRRGAVVSDAIEELCQRALAITPTERYRDAPEMLAALRRLRGSTRPTSIRGASLASNPVSGRHAASSTPSTPSVVVSSSSAGEPISSARKPSSHEAPLPVAQRPARHHLYAAGVAATALLGLLSLALVRATTPDATPPQPSASSGLAASGASSGAASSGVVTEPAGSVEPAASAAPSSSVASESARGMVPIAGGSFQQGATDGEPDEQPTRTVTVASFLLDRTEVTVEAYEACVKATSCPAPRASSGCNWGHPAMRSHPVNCVDWSQAKAYCLWSGKRLPTEEEWEFAARGIEGRKFPWGNDAPGKQPCWSSGLSCEVGALPGDRTPTQVMDLAGNVSEWTASPYCPYGQACAGERRVVRGGHFLDDRPTRLRASKRNAEDPQSRGSHLGFRCAASR